MTSGPNLPSSPGGASSFSRPVGFSDARPAVAHHRAWVRQAVSAVFASHGYEPVEVPTVEYLGLYDRERIGDGLFHGLVTARLSEPALFPARRAERTLPEATHEVALRPELTAPVARMALEWLGSDAPPTLPLRLRAAAPVFRDLGTRALQHREFHQVGAECFGGPRAEGDLETVLLACDVAEALSVPDPEVHLGHAGLLCAVLGTVGVPASASDAVSVGLERAVRLRRKARSPDAVWSVYVAARRPELARLASSDELRRYPALVEEEASLDDLRVALPAAQAAWLARCWQALGLSETQTGQLLSFADCNGTPEAVLPTLRERLGGRSEARAALDEVQTLVEALNGLTTVPLLLSPTANRGAAFYCGLSFELHTPATGAALTDVASGGRVDSLVRWLARQMHATHAVRNEPSPRCLPERLSAVGLAVGVERLASAVPAKGRCAPITVVGRRAMEVARRVRALGHAAVVQPAAPAQDGLWIAADEGGSTLHRGSEAATTRLSDEAVLSALSDALEEAQ